MELALAYSARQGFGRLAKRLTKHSGQGKAEIEVPLLALAARAKSPWPGDFRQANQGPQPRPP
jgi:hypothetical protein